MDPTHSRPPTKPEANRLAGSGGLKAFRALMTDVKNFGGLATKGAVAAPLVDNFVKIGPPPSLFVSFGASLTQLITLIFIFHFWYETRREVLDRRMRISLVAFVSLLVVSLFLINFFTVPVPNKERVVIGYSMLPTVASVVSSTDTPDKLLEGAGWDAKQVYTKTSVVLMETLLPMLWFATFSALSLFLGIFAMVQRSDGPKEPDLKPQQAQQQHARCEPKDESSGKNKKPEFADDEFNEPESF